ncbi:MAG TPA: hypothetical protein VMZ92_11865 [Planctomycetota bacterium]|nr:hypothetical protein [Planctomycetota bacterium]
MGIEFICEHCGKTLDVEEYLAGQRIECYHCHGPVVIPDEDEVAIIEFQCLGCGTEFRVPSSRAGSRTKCPKCEAMLVVPEPVGGMPVSRGAPAPAPTPEAGLVYEDDLPAAPPRTPLVRALQATRRPSPVKPGQPAEGEDEEFVAPPRSGVSAGWIIFFAALALFLVIAIGVFVAKREPSGARTPGSSSSRSSGTRYVQIFAQVKYNGILDVFQIVNATPDVWQDVTFTIETASGNYTVHRDVVAPNDPVTLEGKQFTDTGGTPFNVATTPGTHFVVTARLPSGRMGRFILNWAGRTR